MADAGLIVLVSFISPFRAERDMAREIMGEGEFIEVFVDTPLEECAEARSEGPLRQGAAPARSRTSPASIRPTRRRRMPDVHLENFGRSPDDLVETLELWLHRGGYC